MDEDRSYQKIKSPTDQVRYEFTNQDTVVLRKSGVYYKVVGNSAVMLKILGAKTKIRSGYNSSFEQEVLEMSLHSKNIGDIKEYLETMSSKVLRDDGLFYIVRLKTPIGAKRIRRARGSNELKEEIALDILIKKRYNTPLAKEVRDIFHEVGLLARTMKNQDGQVIGETLLRQAMSLQCSVRVLTRTELPTPDQKLAVDDATDDLLGVLLLVPNFAEQSARLSRIGRSANSIRSYLARLGS